MASSKLQVAQMQLTGSGPKECLAGVKDRAAHRTEGLISALELLLGRGDPEVKMILPLQIASFCP